MVSVLLVAELAGVQWDQKSLYRFLPWQRLQPQPLDRPSSALTITLSYSTDKFVNFLKTLWTGIVKQIRTQDGENVESRIDLNEIEDTPLCKEASCYKEVSWYDSERDCVLRSLSCALAET